MNKENKSLTTEEIKDKIKNGIDEIKKTYKVKESSPILELRADLASNVGILYSNLDEYSESRRYLQLALVGYEKLNLIQKVAAIKGSLGSLYLNDGQLQMAQKFYEDAYEFWKSTNFLNERIVCLQNLGLIHIKREELPKASDYLFEAMKKSISLHDEYQFAASIDILLNYYEQKNRYDMLLELKKKALEFWQSLNLIPRILKTLIDLGVISQILDENSKALNYFKTAFNIAYQGNNLEKMFLSQGFIAESYLKLKNIDKARNIYLQAYKLANIINQTTEFQQHVDEMEVSLLALGMEKDGIEAEAQKVLKEDL